ncbi:MAG: hypothetical protein Q9204_008151 [Flavoplaca sp. TL-2023a]
MEEDNGHLFCKNGRTKEKANENICRFYGTYYDAWTLDDPQSRDWKIKARTLKLFGPPLGESAILQG